MKYKRSLKLSIIALCFISSAVFAQTKNNMTTPSHLADDTSLPFSTQPFDSKILNVGAYHVEQVNFDSHGINVVGNLLLPNTAPRATIVVIGPVAFVKEQSPIQYATRLVKQGYAVLVFDPRYHGESGGEPRRFESRTAKVQDISAAVNFLQKHHATKNIPFYGLGICQGVNWMIEAATLDPRISKISIVAGHYLTPQIAALYTGSTDKAAQRISDAKAAKVLFEQTGEVKYIPIISDSDPHALLGAPVIRQFYTRWADRGSFWNFHGLWENRITQMSEADIWGHDIRPIAAKLTTPVLMIHADHAASGEQAPREIFNNIPATQKQLEWLGNRNQMQFYEDPLTIDLTSEKIGQFFQ